MLSHFDFFDRLWVCLFACSWVCIEVCIYMIGSSSLFGSWCVKLGARCRIHTFQYSTIVGSKWFVWIENEIKTKLDFCFEMSRFAFNDWLTVLDTDIHNCKAVSGAYIHLNVLGKWAYQTCTRSVGTLLLYIRSH